MKWATAAALSAISRERDAQDEKWGVGTGPQYNVDPKVIEGLSGDAAVATIADAYGIPTAAAAKASCDAAAREGDATWADILVEELCEAIEAAALHDCAPSAERLAALRGELVQVAAVAVKWIERLDGDRFKELESQLNTEGYL